jgi:hypothetical protein
LLLELGLLLGLRLLRQQQVSKMQLLLLLLLLQMP